MGDAKRDALLAHVLEAREHTRAALLEFEYLAKSGSKCDSRRTCSSANTNTHTKDKSDG